VLRAAEAVNRGAAAAAAGAGSFDAIHGRNMSNCASAVPPAPEVEQSGSSGCTAAMHVASAISSPAADEDKWVTLPGSPGDDDYDSEAPGDDGHGRGRDGGGGGRRYHADAGDAKGAHGALDQRGGAEPEAALAAAISAAPRLPGRAGAPGSTDAQALSTAAPGTAGKPPAAMSTCQTEKLGGAVSGGVSAGDGLAGFLHLLGGASPPPAASEPGIPTHPQSPFRAVPTGPAAELMQVSPGLALPAAGSTSGTPRSARPSPLGRRSRSEFEHSHTADGVDRHSSDSAPPEVPAPNFGCDPEPFAAVLEDQRAVRRRLSDSDRVGAEPGASEVSEASAPTGTKAGSGGGGAARILLASAGLSLLQSYDSEEAASSDSDTSM
jgi:hypothetical protein